jgi:hypothetical protein
VSNSKKNSAVVYTVVNASNGNDVRIEGDTGIGLVYIALGLAARESFMKMKPVLVTENGVSYRCVSVTLPHP